MLLSTTLSDDTISRHAQENRLGKIEAGVHRQALLQYEFAVVSNLDPTHFRLIQIGVIRGRRSSKASVKLLRLGFGVCLE